MNWCRNVRDLRCWDEDSVLELTGLCMLPTGIANDSRRDLGSDLFLIHKLS